MTKQLSSGVWNSMVILYICIQSCDMIRAECASNSECYPTKFLHLKIS